MKDPDDGKGEGDGHSDLRSRLARQTADPTPLGRDSLDMLRLSDQTSQPDEAVEMARSRVAREPQNNDYKDWLAFLLYSNKKYSEALIHYRDLIQATGGTVSQVYYLANCLAACKSYDEARSRWREVIDREPGSRFASKARTRMQLVRKSRPSRS